MKRITLLLAFLVMSLGMAMAQSQVEVSGTVTSAEDGQPIIGATVRGKTSKKGARTNPEGKFKFTVPQDEKVLIVSFVGMQTREVAVGKNLKIVLQPEATALDEVVAFGYSSGTKRSFTGSAVTVKAEAIEKKNVANVTQALAGEVPGVNVVNTNGQPGTEADLYVRGVGSVNAGRSPLIVVDGVPFSGQTASLNPADIESTTLLKDAASTSIYGARGANGVIVITTKSGRSGAMNISGDIKYGVNSVWLPRHDIIKSPDEYLEMGWSGLHMLAMQRKKDPLSDAEARVWASNNIFGESGINTKYNYYKAEPNAVIDPTTGKVFAGLERRYTPEVWEDEAFQSSNRTEGNLQLSGGTDKMRGFMSVGYLSDKGINKGSDFSRITSRLNVEMNPYTWMKAKASLSYANSASNSSGQSGYSSANLFHFVDGMPPIYPVYTRDKEGNKIMSPYFANQYEFDYGDGRGFSGRSNGLADAIYNTNRTERNEVTYNGNVVLRFLDGFTFENTLGGTFYNSFNKQRGNKWYGDSGNSKGTIYHVMTNLATYNFLSILRYTKKFDKHSIEAFGAHEANYYSFTRDAVLKRNLVDPFNDDLSNAIAFDTPPTGRTDTYRLESYFAQAMYDYANKYFISGTFRRDGSSRFVNNKWGNFGSVGLAWEVSAEEFMKDIKWLPFLKLKASYGTLGQQDGIGYYAGRDLYDIKNDGGNLALALDTKGNPDLTWERSSMLQLGVEFSLGKYLTGSVEYYNKISSDLIYDRRVAPSNGYAIIKVNDGRLQNQGVDIDLTAQLLKTKDYFLDLKVNAGFLSNKMLRMPIEPSTGEPKYIDTSVGGYGRQKGRSLFDYYMREYVGVDDETGLSQWTMYFWDKDEDGTFSKGDAPIGSYEEFLYKNPDAKVGKSVTSVYQDASQFYIGKSALATVRGGVSLAAGFKGLELNLQFIYSLGGYGYDGVYATLMDNEQVGKSNWHVDMRDRWTPENKTSDIPRLNNGLDSNVASRSSRFLTSNSFLHFANARLGYNIPKEWLSAVNVKNLKVWVSGDNLALWSARRGFNPSTSLSGGSSTLTYNPMTTVTAGLSINF
ncbi:SusC/RagA family TonB-linked outer membrane protein [Porphyromonas sp.]|uniref:SusC/RagA family TonB-linked outer membrane protein n=1 Tax=Porphyromonas sp. TaxID=1924944 RepID=UPI0026DC64A5|nr:SusC/RagA family TonB-linked outer membrane protein [Porphyromonas sp.]MDO4770963.1 SusC/RagA family TonB-linked outer membrane protein [Porphyromonas sp.]